MQPEFSANSTLTPHRQNGIVIANYRLLQFNFETALSCSNPTMSRVAERDLTSPPSQNRTGRSRVIRLLPSGLRSYTVFPQDKQLGVPSRDASQPVH